MSNTITIDNKEYNIEDLTDDVKKSLQSMNFMDARIQSLDMEIAATQTARSVYGAALSQNLPQETEETENILQINDKKYAIKDLSEEARKQASSFKFSDEQLLRLNGELSIAKTARNAYAKSVRDGLAK